MGVKPIANGAAQPGYRWMPANATLPSLRTFALVALFTLANSAIDGAVVGLSTAAREVCCPKQGYQSARANGGNSAQAAPWLAHDKLQPPQGTQLQEIKQFAAATCGPPRG